MDGENDTLAESESKLADKEDLEEKRTMLIPKKAKVELQSEIKKMKLQFKRGDLFF